MASLNAPCVRFSFIALACLVVGCATIGPPATPELDTSGKSFTVAPGKANIYVYRNENLSAEAMRVYVNGKAAGATGRATYILWEVDPGTYDISSGSAVTSAAHIVAEPGKSYYIWQQVTIDRSLYLFGIVIPGSDLHVVNDETGRWGVSECTRIQSAL
jgi:hypothetical protein